MATIPCKDKSLCIDGPISNFSSEDPDADVFIGLSGGLPFYDPPLGTPWTRESCLGLCVSTESQEAADLCAVLAELQCLGGDNPGTTLFYNGPQFASAFCPDGSVFTYYFAGGQIASDSQASADDQAREMAIKGANAERICLGPLSRCCCIDVGYSDEILSDRVTQIEWEIVSGAMPPGVSLKSNTTSDGKVEVSGTPTSPGIYVFQVKATTPTGSYMTKSYVITVIEIADDTLPEWTSGVPYSHQLSAVGGSGEYVWSIKLGALPAGLTMSQSGLISGTPL